MRRGFRRKDHQGFPLQWLAASSVLYAGMSSGST